jgi:hypothetical protein
MRLFGWIVFLSVSVPLCLALGAAPKEKLIVVNGPTVVAFFPPVTDAELSRDPDTNESVADFQLYAARVREKLNNAGIEFEEIHVSSFAVRCGAKTTTFRSKKATVGYYFIAPGKSPRVEYGVMTDVDILRVVAEYSSVRKPAPIKRPRFLASYFCDVVSSCRLPLRNPVRNACPHLA